MTREAVRRWIGTMKAEGLARSDGDCADALGVSRNTLTNWRNSGVPSKIAALAMAAALNRMEPYE